MADERQALLERARGGEAAAWGELLESFRPYVRRLVQATRAGVPDARAGDSDLIQDAMLIATRAFERFRGASVAELAGWLREVTIRTVGHAARFHRSARRRDAGREVAVADLDELALSDGSSPDAKAMGHELHARLAAALEKLPDAMRELLHGRVIDGLDYKELARRTGRTEGALRVHYVRALRKLREALEED